MMPKNSLSYSQVIHRKKIYNFLIIKALSINKRRKRKLKLNRIIFNLLLLSIKLFKVRILTFWLSYFTTNIDNVHISSSKRAYIQPSLS